jgi:hypothetical protein
MVTLYAIQFMLGYSFIKEYSLYNDTICSHMKLKGKSS